MIALAIAKLSLIMRMDEVSGLSMKDMRRREATELMKSENKRDQLQVGQHPAFLLFRSSLAESFSNLLYDRCRCKFGFGNGQNGPKQSHETEHKTEHYLPPYWTTPHYT
jgi:hypothetical protein